MSNDSSHQLYDHHITVKKDLDISRELTEDQYLDYISHLIFTGSDGRLWAKYGHIRVYYDRLNGYYDILKKEWFSK